MSDRQQSVALRNLRAQLRRFAQPQIWGGLLILTALGFAAWEYFTRPTGIDPDSVLADAILRDRREMGLTDEDDEFGLTADIESSDVIEQMRREREAEEGRRLLPPPRSEGNEEEGNPLQALIDFGRDRANTGQQTESDSQNLFADLTPVGIFAGMSAASGDAAGDRNFSSFNNPYAPTDSTTAGTTSQPLNQLQLALDRLQMPGSSASGDAEAAETVPGDRSAEAAGGGERLRAIESGATDSGNLPLGFNRPASSPFSRFSAPSGGYVPNGTVGSTGYAYPTGNVVPPPGVGSTGYAYPSYYGAPSSVPVQPAAPPNAVPNNYAVPPSPPGTRTRFQAPSYGGAPSANPYGNYNRSIGTNGANGTLNNTTGTNPNATPQQGAGGAVSPYGTSATTTPQPYSVPRNVPGRYIGNGEINTFSNP